MKKNVYGWSKAVPDSVNLSQVESVIDVGAGTCIWTLDLLDIPEIQAQLDGMRVYVCDIEMGLFPEPTLNERGVIAFKHDVTKPFPEDLRGTFDLVHASYLVGGLTADGWSSALANYHSLLKPGGLLMVDETDTLFLPENLEQDLELLDAATEDLSKYFQGNSWIHTANYIYITFALRKGLIPQITSRLHSMLERAGFRVEEFNLDALPLGPPCRSRLGRAGGSLAEYEEFSWKNVELVLTHLAAHLSKAGTLEAPPGRAIIGEAEMNAALREIGDGMRKDGAFSRVGYFVCRRSDEDTP